MANSCGECASPPPQTVRLCDPGAPERCGATVKIGAVPLTWRGRTVSLRRFMRLSHCFEDGGNCGAPLTGNADVGGARALFATPPELSGGDLSFAIANRSAGGAVPPCLETAATSCVHVALRLRMGVHRADAWTRIRLVRDPCGPAALCSGSRVGCKATACRNGFLSFEYDCSELDVGVSAWDRLFPKFDGALRWGYGQTLAVVGGAVREPSRGFRPYSKAKGVFAESTKWNPAWDAPTGPSAAPKLLGSSSFFPPAGASDAESYVDTRPESGAHDYQLAWLAVQAPGVGHTTCDAAAAPSIGCTLNADAHDAVSSAFDAAGQESGCRAGSPLRYAMRPSALAFNAHAYLLRVYGGSRPEHRARLRNQGGDYYVDNSLRPNRSAIGVGASAVEPASGGPSKSGLPARRYVPEAVVTSLRDAFSWAADHHAALNITVLAIGVLTLERFAADPEASAGLAGLVDTLLGRGLLVLANVGNCRMAMRNCTGLPWPAITAGVVPVGNAVGARSRMQKKHHVSGMSLDAADCDRTMPFVCGAKFSSAALPVFAAHAMVLREAFDVFAFPWTEEGATMQAAILAVSRKTGWPIYPTWKANRCPGRWCIDSSAALRYVSLGANRTAREEFLASLVRPTLKSWPLPGPATIPELERRNASMRTT